uniref:Uncharacterized protein n=1 Tax=uncultured marine virus TaxID=186617 RepID=A0A0F7L5C7_9VIRU|nr:hypothetical protein [uncultured marine virus]
MRHHRRWRTARGDEPSRRPSGRPLAGCSRCCRRPGACRWCRWWSIPRPSTRTSSPRPTSRRRPWTAGLESAPGRQPCPSPNRAGGCSRRAVAQRRGGGQHGGWSESPRRVRSMCRRGSASLCRPRHPPRPLRRSGERRRQHWTRAESHGGRSLRR